MPTTPDPAERRHILRGAIECAIGLNTSTRTGQTAPLTAAVWRIVEPALAQRDRQVEAVRALHHEWTGGAPGCCAHCQDGMGTPLPWPCPTIRALDARRPTPEPEPPRPPLLARRLVSWVPACPTGRHVAHPSYTCEEQEQAADAWDRYVSQTLGAAPAHIATTDVPPALQGPGWEPPPGVPGPLRDLAARALAEEQPPAADPEYDALKASYHEAVKNSAHRVTVLEPDPAAEARAVVQAVTREQLHDAIRTLARTDPAWWDGELRRMARLEGRTSLLGGGR